MFTDVSYICTDFGMTVRKHMKDQLTKFPLRTRQEVALNNEIHRPGHLVKCPGEMWKGRTLPR